jgi:kynurenine formamidase
MRVLAGCLALCLAAAVAAQDLRIVDLTHPLEEDMALWPGGEPFRMERVVDYDQGYRVHRFEMGENVGTHVDAPSHFIEGGPGIDAIAPGKLVAELVIVDVRRQAARNPDYAVQPRDLVAHESQYGRIPEGSVVVAYTGWYERFSDPPRYANQDEAGTMHFPGWSREAAALAVERRAAGIGIDTLSIDPGNSRDFAAHRLALGAGLYQLENLTNLEDVPLRGATVVVGVLPVRDGTQAPARVLALVPSL